MPKPKAETKEVRRERLKTALEQTSFPCDDLRPIIINAIHNHSGSLEVLQSAIGCMFLCMYMGRRVMQIVHSLSTIRKYERILGITFKELPFISDVTENSTRSVGYNIALGAADFWDYVRGAKLPGNDNLSSVDATPEPV